MNDIDLGVALTLISIGAAVVAVFYTAKGSKRTDKQDAALGATQLTRIETMLDGVRAGVDDIRVEMRSQQKQINDHEARITRIETRCEMKGE